jgi:uncharacterized membrane protein YkvA (DUF1232 family)
MTKTIELMNKPNPLLAAYMHYVSDEGIDFDRFVEQGGRLLGTDDSASLSGELPALREKIQILRKEYPLFGRQLEFLIGFVESVSAKSFDQARKEATFALLYAAKDMDMMPDHVPGVGYLDDAAVAKVVFSRHTQIFERHCAVHGIEWSTLTEVPTTA